MSSDDLVSQFMAFSGCLEVELAQQYLEMSNMSVETAVGLYMEHEQQGNGGGGAGMASPEIRAPDRTRTMRLMDYGGIPHEDMTDEQNNFINVFGEINAGIPQIDARAVVNAAAASANDSGREEKDSDHPERRLDENAGSLTHMFAPPTHLMHRGGGFQGSRAVARDARRWLLVNIQRDSEFACHALNRDVWRDELVENLVREGFIFWQANHDSSEGKTYVERYKVYDYPHVAIVDPRTGRLLWKKEGWTQEKPFTAEHFAEMAMDFCSRHSFDKAPLPPSKKNVEPNGTGERKRPFMSEDEQIKAAMNESLKQGHAREDNDDDEYAYAMEEVQDDASDDDVVRLATNEDNMSSLETDAVQDEPEMAPTFIETLLAIEVGDEPANGARVQLRMPDATRLVRRFVDSESVKSIYAYVAQNSELARAGKEFVLMVGFPPKNLEGAMENTIDSCGLDGQAVTVRWKD